MYAAGEDFAIPEKSHLTLSSNVGIQISVPIINDGVFELRESFLVNLSFPREHSSQSSAEVIILDDDGMSVSLLSSLLIYRYSSCTQS